MEGRADLEQGRVGEAPARVAAGRVDQVGQQRRAHAVQFRGDRIGQQHLRLTAAEQLGRLAAGEAEGHGFRIARRRERTTRGAAARLLGGQDAADGARNFRQRRRGQGAVAGDAGDFFHQVGLAFHVAAEGRRGHADHALGMGDEVGGRDVLGRIDAEAQIAKDLQRAFRLDLQARQLADIGRVEQHGRRGGQGLADQQDFRRLAAAEFQDQLGGQLDAGHQRAGVDGASEAVLGVAGDAGGAAGLGRADRIEPGALDEDVRGLVRAAGALAAHHAAQADRALARGVGDHRHLRGQLVGLAVQRDQVLVAVHAMAAQAGRDLAPRQLGGVIDVQRAGAVVGDQVGDVHEGVDRAQADGGQAVGQPLGRGTVLDAADVATGEHRAGFAVDLDGDRGDERAWDRRDRDILQLAHAGGGQVAGDAHNAQPVGAVGGHFEVDDGFQAQGVDGARADRQGVGQLHDAVAFGGVLQLGGRAEHAVRDDAADGLLDQGHVQAGHIGADRGVDGGQARTGVRRTADDLLAAVDGVDLADLETVGVRVAGGLDDLADRERGQLGRRIGDVLDLEPGHGHGRDDLGDGGGGLKVILEPGEGEFHRSGLSSGPRRRSARRRR